MRTKANRGSASFWLPLIAGTLAILLVGGYFGYFWGKGTASKSIKGGGFTRTESGWGLGFESFRLKRGQSIQVDYDLTKCKAGKLRIVFKTTPKLGLTKVVSTQKIDKVGPGAYRFKAPKDGLYRIEFDGTPDGNGYDLTYTANWQVTH